MEPSDETWLGSFFRALTNEPLGPEDERYVATSAVRSACGSVRDSTDRLARRIAWAPRETVQLLSGLQGTGKSTELRRLGSRLGPHRFGVVVCDLVPYVSLSIPLEIGELLIALTRALGDALAGLGLGNRQESRIRTSSLVRLSEDVRACMAEYVDAVRRQHGEQTGLVVAFDSIDRMEGTSDDQTAVVAAIERIFVEHADLLRFPSMHVIYTVPPWLQLRMAGLACDYDGIERMTCMTVQRGDGEPVDATLAVLRELVGQRGDWTRVFGSVDDFDHVLLETGGHLGSLFRALRGMLLGAAVRGRIPLDREVIDDELAMLRDEYLPIAIEDAVWLHELGLTRGQGLGVPRAAANVPRALDRGLLLEYGAGGSRYEVHPLVRGTVARVAERERGGSGAGAGGMDLSCHTQRAPCSGSIASRWQTTSPRTSARTSPCRR